MKKRYLAGGSLALLLLLGLYLADQSSRIQRDSVMRFKNSRAVPKRAVAEAPPQANEADGNLASASKSPSETSELTGTLEDVFFWKKRLSEKAIFSIDEKHEMNTILESAQLIDAAESFLRATPSEDSAEAFKRLDVIDYLGAAANQAYSPTKSYAVKALGELIISMKPASGDALSDLQRKFIAGDRMELFGFLVKADKSEADRVERSIIDNEARDLLRMSRLMVKTGQIAQLP